MSSPPRSLSTGKSFAFCEYSLHSSCSIGDGGGAFALGTYEQARPWAKAIQEEVLERTMPPWGAVKGFGEFRNDQALTPEEMEAGRRLGGRRRPGGGEPKDLPQQDPAPSAKTPAPAPWAAPRDAGKVPVSADYKVPRPLKVAGVWPSKVAPGASFQVTAELPDGSIQPLLWLQPFKPTYSHPFWFQTPLSLPPGTVVRGVPPGNYASTCFQPPVANLRCGQGQLAAPVKIVYNGFQLLLTPFGRAAYRKSAKSGTIRFDFCVQEKPRLLQISTVDDGVRTPRI